MSLMIVDGNNICMRAFHTAQGDLCTKAGEYTGSMLGLLNSLKMYLDKFPETEKVIVAFDGGRSKWRMNLYPEYKGNRDYSGDTPEMKAKFDGLWKQLNILNEFLPKLGVHSIKIAHQEADDIIAAICKYAPDTHKMIISGDEDFYQLIDVKTSIYSPNRDRVISPLNFFEEAGVTREAFTGYKALVGDTSDNITGIPGIGAVTAKSLMNTYGHIDNVLNARGKDKEKLMKSARTKKIFEPENLKVLGRNNKLVNFRYVNYDDFKDQVDQALNTDLVMDSKAVKDFLVRWQFASILSNYMSWSLSFKALGSQD